jgi:hypothetical protein
MGAYFILLTQLTNKVYFRIFKYKAKIIQQIL